MSEYPYTTADLHAEAARQHATLAEDPDFVGVGERMQWTPIPSRPDDHWDDLNEADFETAQRAIDDLLTKAADLSDWAITLGADGLQPDEHVLSVGAGEQTIARIHFAFEPDMDDDMRAALVEGLGQAIADAL
ncbi:hypothetical protein ACGFWI_01055 [Streptomyces sp. NPDC048434]|uniref:hypothetical protein n=1 Tax=Streptomyces sp. NPDC048434 TaxID=3365549 RepID=UPI00371863B3